MASNDTTVVTMRSTWSKGTPKNLSQNALIKSRVCTTRDIGDPIHRVAESANHSTFLSKDVVFLLFAIYECHEKISKTV